MPATGEAEETEGTRFMTWNIIVASSDADQLEELLHGAEAIGLRLKPRVPVAVWEATSVDELVRKRNPETKLLIVAASLAQVRSSSDDEHEPGLNFVKSLASEPEPPACIVVSDRIELFRIVQTIKQCELLMVDNTTNYIEQCVGLARRLGIVQEDPSASTSGRGAPAISLSGAEAVVERQPPGTRPSAASPADEIALAVAARPTEKAPYALIEVELPNDATFGLVRLEIHEPGKVTKYQELLRLDQSELQELIAQSKVLKGNLSKWQQDPIRWKRHYEHWHADYSSLGERVSRLLWGSTSFAKYYNRGHGAARGNVRVRFNLEQPWFDGLWEAIFGENNDRSLILDNTIVRRVAQRGESGVFTDGTGQIDTDDGVLNVLVIKSNVAPGSTPKGPSDPLWRKYWKSYKGKLPELKHLDEEVQVLKDLEQVKGNKKLQVNVDVIGDKPPLAGEAWSLAAELESRLIKESRRYDIVHFAGHALFAEGPEQDARGYLVFSGYPDPEAVTISKVAKWLAKAGVQLVYLSCCRSSAASAALEFARRDIPMAIGFHWDLDDSKAPVFAKEFYKELLGTKLKVCPAIGKARSTLHDDYDRGDPIWASPVLIAQPMDWGQVEDVLKLAAQAPTHPTAGRSDPRAA
jgi:hypothetical protein